MSTTAIVQIKFKKNLFFVQILHDAYVDNVYNALRYISSNVICMKNLYSENQMIFYIIEQLSRYFHKHFGSIHNGIDIEIVHQNDINKYLPNNYWFVELEKNIIKFWNYDQPENIVSMNFK
jgi:hypothetical protein